MDDEVKADRLSKTRIKQDLLSLQNVALQLAELPVAELDAIAMDERLADGVTELRRLKAHSARKRQMKFVAKLLRDVDLAPFQQALASRQRMGQAAADQLHAAEDWRDQLLEGDDAVVAWLAKHPASKPRQLRALVADARRERAAAEADMLAGRPARKGKAYRELFKFLRAELVSGAD